TSPATRCRSSAAGCSRAGRSTSTSGRARLRWSAPGSSASRAASSCGRSPTGTSRQTTRSSSWSPSASRLSSCSPLGSPPASSAPRLASVLWEKVKDLAFEVGDVTMAVAVMPVTPEFERRTTTVHLRREMGARSEYWDGLGEDVTYDPSEHEPHRFPWVDLRGDWTLESLSRHLDETDLFPNGEPGQPAYRDYRRWAFESAALDYALKANGIDIADALERRPQPVRFLCSMHEATLAPWLELSPELRFKLDPPPEWTDGFVDELAVRDIVDVLDLKGRYTGTPVDNPPDAELYRRVAEAFPNAWIE